MASLSLLFSSDQCDVHPPAASTRLWWRWWPSASINGRKSTRWVRRTRWGHQFVFAVTGAWLPAAVRGGGRTAWPRKLITAQLALWLGCSGPWVLTGGGTDDQSRRRSSNRWGVVGGIPTRSQLRWHGAEGATGLPVPNSGSQRSIGGSRGCGACRRRPYGTAAPGSTTAVGLR